MAGQLYRKPWPGLVAFFVAISSQWLGHAAWAFLRGVFGEHHHYACLTIGAIGAGLIFAGLRKPEIPATWMGFLGALLVWVGWFEFGFDFYSELFSVPQYTSPTGLPVGPGGALLMGTLPIMVATFVIYGVFNRQTKCNLLRWIHRNIGANPGMPTEDNGRSFARITAMETLFVTWACYLFWLYVGYFLSNTMILIAYAGWAAWFFYIFVRLLKIPRMGHAVRYGIPVGIIGWGLSEMPAHFGLYREIWLKPFDYPVANVLMLLSFTAGMIYVARRAVTSREAAEPSPA
jgi:hypothetical protein